jgi:23S rRNA U2552 (ribose-2'-O)-methylase RlmE/FtsJ
MSYTPFIYKVPNLDINNIFKNNDVHISTNISQPLFSLGFHSFIHRTKSAMEITKKIETEKEFYYIVNPFEHIINDYSNDIEHESDVFLNKPNIQSRDFYKIWEILYLFDLANEKKMTMVALADGIGNCIHPFIEFREKYFDPSKDTIHGINNSINKDLVESINDKYENMLNMPKSSSSKKKGDKLNLTKEDISSINITPKILGYLKNNVNANAKANLVTADGELKIEWENENYREQESYSLILGEIIAAINVQEKDGNFVLKIFESFTHATIKLIYLLTGFYNDVYIYKPYFSRATSSEKYLVCKGFKFNSSNDELNKKIKYLEDTYKKAESKNLFINDIFPEFILTNEYLNIFKYININIANVQQIMINNLVVYIKSNNYFGDAYHNYRDLQIKANKWWIENFFTDKLNDKASLIKETVKYNDSELNIFSKKIE